MRKNFSTQVVFVVVVVISISVPGTAAFAWDASTHAYEANKILKCGPICSYNARMGSLAPDFAWYLMDIGLIKFGEATGLHDGFCMLASKKLNWWNFRLRYFVDGARTHVCADEIADGWIAEWLGAFPGEAIEFDEEAYHVSYEFAVGSLLAYQRGLQAWDLSFAYSQAIFVETVVEGYLGRDLGDVSMEFKKYLALMRALEKLAALYAPYLMKGEVDEGALSILEGSELMDLEPELSEEGLNMYLKVLLILLMYPSQIYETITSDGMDWEYAVQDAIDFCKNPICQ